MYVLRACETGNEVENIVMDALETIESLHLARSSVIAEQRCGCPGGRPQTDCSQVVAGCNDEVGRTDEPTKQVHMTWVEDATKYEDKQCLQRDVTEVDVSRRGAGRTCLMLL